MSLRSKVRSQDKSASHDFNYYDVAGSNMVS